MTLNKSSNQKVFQLLHNAIDTLIVMADLFSVDNYLTLDEKAQIFIFCDKIHKLISVDSLKLLNQLIKSMDKISYKYLKHELDCISKNHKGKTFHHVNMYVSHLESKVMNLACQRKFELDKILEKSLKQVVSIAIKVILFKFFTCYYYLISILI